MQRARELDCWSKMEPPDTDSLGVEWAAPEEADTLALLLAQTRRFLVREVDPRKIDETRAIPQHVRDAAASVGLFALTIPEADGGLGLSLKAACRVVEEIARVDRSVAVMIGLHAGLGTRALVESGTEIARARWLPRMASGEIVGAFAATEPQAGSDLMAVSTRAVPVEGGWAVRGEKCFVTNGAFAGLFTVLVRTPGHEGGMGHTLVCIPRDAAGLEIASDETKMGIRGSSAATVLLDGVIVPDAHVLGVVGAGLSASHEVLGWGRTLLSAGCVGTARAALDATLVHVGGRRQFGRAIGDHALVRRHVAEMGATVYAMESLVRWAGVSEARARGLGAPSLVAKVFCSEGAFRVCDQAIQLHGALGFLESTGIPRTLRDCRVTRIFEGANDVLALRHGAALAASAGAVPPPPIVSRVPIELRDVADRWHGAALGLRNAIGRARREHGLAVVRQQIVLESLARADIDLRAAAAAIARGAGDGAQRIVAEHAGEMLVTRAIDRMRAIQEARSDDVARESAVAENLYGAGRNMRWDDRREVRVAS